MGAGSGGGEGGRRGGSDPGLDKLKIRRAKFAFFFSLAMPCFALYYIA